ncbi:FUN14 domain-containing protein 2 [Ovis aries]|uniref:FUN14 domain-containing protein 2 n=1 Tax=Ovis aries TaxID=9940 RepID=UPI001C2E89B9|nr:FUN14 domain-containing protein 2 [Ovis aries]
MGQVNLFASSMRAAASQGNFEGKFESLDLAELAKKQPWWRTLFGQESGPSAEKYSVATQLLIGGVTGWCTGFIFQKVGKLAATAVGGGFFLLQLANHTGYIKVDWQRVEKDMKKAKEQLKIRKSNQIPTEVKSKAEEVVSFVKKNVLVTFCWAWHPRGDDFTTKSPTFANQQPLPSTLGQKTPPLPPPCHGVSEWLCRHLVVQVENGPTASLTAMEETIDVSAYLAHSPGTNL